MTDKADSQAPELGAAETLLWQADYLENCRRLNEHERDRWADELAADLATEARNG